jgi:hypothetical protein
MQGGHRQIPGITLTTITGKTMTADEFLYPSLASDRFQKLKSVTFMEWSTYFRFRLAKVTS